MSFLAYQKTKKELEELESRLNKLAEHPAVKNANDFRKAFDKLLSKYEISESEAVSIITPSVINSSPKVSRKPRAKVTYRNPHTKESVTTAGPNNRTLREWREKYGADKVRKWATIEG